MQKSEYEVMGTMHKLMRYIKGYEKQAVLAPLFKMLEATFELFVPLVVASIIDTGIKNGDAVFIWQRCGLLVLLAAIGLTCSLTAQYFSAKAALGWPVPLRLGAASVSVAAVTRLRRRKSAAGPWAVCSMASSRCPVSAVAHPCCPARRSARRTVREAERDSPL